MPIVEVSIGPIDSEPVNTERVVKIIFYKHKFAVGRLSVQVEVVLVEGVTVPMSNEYFCRQCFQVVIDFEVAFHVTRKVAVADVV